MAAASMHTIWVRLNAVVFFGLSVLLGLSCLAGISKLGHSLKNKPSEYGDIFGFSFSINVKAHILIIFFQC